jgi:hypothetical protein
MDDRVTRWNARQRILQQLLAANGAEGHDFRVDLGHGRFWWQDPDSGRASVVASARVLCSYAWSNQSVLAAWANQSLPEGGGVPAVPDVPDRIADCSAEEAWELALEIAEGSGAHFVYRVPSTQMWIFLGLWDVRPAGPGDAPFQASSPWPHVLEVLTQLIDHVRTNVDDTMVLARNYGHTFVENEIHEGTPTGDALRSVGERLVALGEGDPEVMPSGLAALHVEVSGYAVD